MSSQRLAALAGAFVFLVLALIALARLLVGFNMNIGGIHVGQTASFFAFVICAAIALILFRTGRQVSD